MDSWICQTSTASPAEPGGLFLWARNRIAFRMMGRYLRRPCTRRLA